MESAQNLLSSEIQIDATGNAHLKETAMWGKLLAIVGFIMSVLLALLGLFFDSVNEELSGGYGSRESNIMVSVIYVVIAAVYFAMSLYMFRFSGKMKIALETTDQENFNTALYNLKMVYRITGIIVIIYLALLALALIVAIAASAFNS